MATRIFAVVLPLGVALLLVSSAPGTARDGDASLGAGSPLNAGAVTAALAWSEHSEADTAETAPMGYAVVARRDEHVLGGVRVVMTVQLSRDASQPELWRIGEEIILRERTHRRVSAITIIYCGPDDARAAGSAATAKAVWAPDGDWDAAHTVRLGDYSRHRHVLAGGDGSLNR